MKTEEKAKAYDEALKQVKKELAACGSMNCDAARLIFRLFPQLCESCEEFLTYLKKKKDHFRDDTKMVEQEPAQTVDEKEYIRTIKGIIADFIREKKPEDVAYYQQIYDWLDGRHVELKEQKPCEPKNWPADKDTIIQEHKPAEKEITLNGFEKVLDSFLFDFVHSPIIDCEPKEYIKNHSAYLLKAAYKELNAQLKQDLFEAQQEGRQEGYEAAMAEQKPAEWSEEDEKMLQRIIRHTESEYQDWCNDKYGNSEIVSDGKRSCLERLDWLENRLKSLRPQPHKEIYQAAKHDLAIKFMHYLDKNRPEGKMCLSNGECEDIDKAFKEGDWAKIIRYIKKYQPHWKPSREQMETLKRYSPVHHPDVHLVSLYDDLKKLM